MHALIIHKQWLRKILDGSKTWEIRGSKTTNRGEIALIQKGSGKIVGTCKIVDVIGPLTKQYPELNIDKHQIPEDELTNIIASYPKPHAWVLNE